MCNVGIKPVGAARLPLHPRHPERVCWGCERYCPADDLGCANGAIRTPHPVELFGEDWLEWGEEHASGHVNDAT